MEQLIKLKDIIIYKTEAYNTFPNAVMTEEGKLLVAFRQAPERQKLLGQVTHTDSASRGVYITSADGGTTWSAEPALLVEDFACGIQDPCVTKLRDGTLFATYFTWKVLEKEEVTDAKPWDHEIQGRWVGRIGGLYSLYSTDHGATWSLPLPITGGGRAVRGNPVELKDGTLVLPSYGGLETKGQVFILSSTDRGGSWQRLALLETDGYLFHEPFLYQALSGKLVLLTRSRNQAGPESNGRKSPLFTAESSDGGTTWSPLVKRPFYSPSPFHALRLHSDKVLVTYGYRFEPYGIRAFLIDSEFSDWSAARETVLRDDGHGYDLGYTSAVQLPNGDILITYYYYYEERGLRYIAGTYCREAKA